MFASLISAIQTEQFELASSLAGEYGKQITPEQAEAAIRNLTRALELARVIRAHLALRTASIVRQSAYESALCVPGRWAVEA
ncbi:MAG TPA: hypothetical protein VLI55_11410 [Bryobacteraceae bacterium]|nr:hypothetical protein [Bryobacteraceae bacterium]